MKENKLKIVIAINNMAIGGAQKLIVDQFKYFDTKKFDYSLIILSKLDEYKDFISLLPTDLKIYQFNFKSFKSFFEWIKLFLLLYKIRPDLVRTSLFMADTIFRIFKPFFGYQVISTSHNTHYDLSKAKKITNKILSYLTYKIVADSNMVANFTAKDEKIDRDKFVTIYNGVDLDEINAAKTDHSIAQGLRSALGIKEEEKIILNIARLVKQKNHKLLIDSFYEFSKSHKNYRLLIVGDGALRADLDNQIKLLNIEDKVIFPGSTQEIAKFYMISDIFAVSSFQEGFCLVAMMALAFGRPVVSTKVAGIIEYIEDYKNGLLAEYDAVDFAAKLSFIADLSHDDLMRYRNNCIAISENFDMKVSAKKYEDLFLEALNKK